MPDLIPTLLDTFDPYKPLPPGDSRYVDCDAERGSDSLRQLLMSTIRNSSSPKYQLLGGHRGAGKTTELFRVKKVLEDQGFFVVYCEADSYLNLQDTVEYSEVLLAVAQQLWVEADAVGVRLETNRLLGVAQELWSILNRPVELTDIGLKAGFADIKLAVKNDPDYRQLVRQHLRPKASQLRDVVNEVISLARQAFHDKQYKDVVVIVDNLDRLLRLPVPGSERTSHEALFIDSADHLRSVQCHMIYTLPTALRHSMGGAQLDDLYGAPPRLLPMIPINARTGDPCPGGIAKLVEIIEARIKYAGTETSTVFDAASTLDRLAIASGGYVRALMTLCTEALNYTDTLPIRGSAAESAIRGTRNNQMNALRDKAAWQKLRDVAATKTVDRDELYLQMLQSFVVLEYLDEEGPWFDAAPTLKETERFREA